MKTNRTSPDTGFRARNKKAGGYLIKAKLKKAAVSGVAEAWYFLAVCYRNGYGVRFNPGLTAEAAKKSADTGNSYGQLLYGVCFRDGIGVARDLDKARRYFEMSAVQNNRHARAALAELNIARETASGKQVFDKASLAMLERSAAEGDVNSKYLLGKIYKERRRRGGGTCT